MNIQEAVRTALETDKCIYRQSEKERGINTVIKPTRSSWDCCIITSPKVGKSEARWNPTSDDLIASDWELIKLGGIQNGND